MSPVRRLALALLLLPTLILLAWAAWLALERATPGLRVDIRGYDPRDLLRGHYLQFRLDLPPEAAGAGCACLAPSARDPARAEARAVPCETAALRACPLPVRDPDRTFRYYLSERRALELEALLREPARRVSVEVRGDGRGAARFAHIQVDR